MPSGEADGRLGNIYVRTYIKISYANYAFLGIVAAGAIP
jgi:hypothetical protein